MKNLFKFVFTLAMLVGGFAFGQLNLTSLQEDIVLREELSAEFVSSDDFIKINENIKSFGDIDTKDCKLVQRTIGDIKVAVLHYKILKDDKVVAYLQFLKGEDGKYYNQLVNLENYSKEEHKGNVTFWDMLLNIKVLTVTIEGDRVVETQINNDDYLISSQASTERKRDPFDLNGNGDVSFFECYKLTNDAIEEDGFSSWVCDFPVIGWLSCWGSVSAACAYYSAGH